MSAEEEDDDPNCEERRKKEQEEQKARAAAEKAKQDALVANLQKAFLKLYNESENRTTYYFGSQNQTGSDGNDSYSSMSANTIGQLTFLSGVGFAEEGYSILNSEYMRQARYNNSILKPGFNKEIISSLKVPKGLRFLGKYGGTVFNLFEARSIEAQYRRGEISKDWRNIEHQSNFIGALPVIGTSWTLGWETGRALVSIPAYRTYIRDPLRSVFGVDP